MSINLAVPGLSPLEALSGALLAGHSGAARRAEPGIQKQGTSDGLDSGFAPSARPGMTAVLKAKAKNAAQNFESVFLNTMFNSMYTGIDGEGPFGGNGASGVWRSMLTDQYARSFAKAGGIGLASHVYQSLLAQQEVKP